MLSTSVLVLPSSISTAASKPSRLCKPPIESGLERLPAATSGPAFALSGIFSGAFSSDLSPVLSANFSAACADDSVMSEGFVEFIQTGLALVRESVTLISVPQFQQLAVPALPVTGIFLLPVMPAAPIDFNVLPVPGACDGVCDDVCDDVCEGGGAEGEMLGKPR